MVTRYNSITTNKTFIELGKIKIYTEDVNTDEQEHERNAFLESRLVVQFSTFSGITSNNATLQMQSLTRANCLIS